MTLRQTEFLKEQRDDGASYSKVTYCGVYAGGYDEAWRYRIPVQGGERCSMFRGL